MSSVFSLHDAGVQYGTACVLRSVSLTLQAGTFVSIGGPNGAGKSTLLSLLSGLAKPTVGSCRFLGREVYGWPRKEFARRVAVVLQSEPLAFPFTVRDVVSMGRTPHSSGLRETQNDQASIARALQETGTECFRDREFRTLSGGEKQRVLLASALAQDPQALLLDEPATHLDIQHQVELHQLLQRLSKSGLLIVSVTHDLNFATAYSDRLILIHKGQVRADGAPIDVLQPPLVSEIFQVNVEVNVSSSSGKPWLSYGPLHA